MFGRIYKRLNASWSWVRALKRATEGNFSEALRSLESAEKFGVPLRSEFYTLKGFLYYAIEENKKAIETLILAYEIIGEDSTLTSDEKKYLRCYASIWGVEATKRIDWKKQTPFSIDLEKISLDKVSGHLKSNFPLRMHPDWPNN